MGKGNDFEGMLDLGQPNRRKFLRWVGRAGVATLTFAAAMRMTEQAAEAAPVCCNLLYPPGSSKYCKGDGSGSFVCSGTGYKFAAWYCCVGSRTYACAECSKSTDCWSTSTIKCSAYWTVSPNKCTQAISVDALQPRMDPEDAKRWKTNPWAPPATAEELAQPAQMFPPKQGLYTE